MAQVFALKGSDRWTFRAVNSTKEFFVAGVVPLPEARRVIAIELDREYGRKGWAFFN